MKATLFDSQHTDDSGKLLSSRFIQMELSEKGWLIECVDAGKTVEDFYNDFDVEFFISVKRNELRSLKNVMGLKEEISDSDLFDVLKGKFEGEQGFMKWKVWLKENNIKFEFDVWV